MEMVSKGRFMVLDGGRRSQFFKGVADTLTCSAIAVRVVGKGHALVGGLVLEQGERFADDAVVVRTDEAHRACSDGLGTFGRVAHYQHRLAQRRCLFLDATRVGQDDVTALHEVYEGQVVQRFDQMHIRGVAQDAADRLLDLRVEVNWIDHLHTRLTGNVYQGVADGFKASPEIFAPVSSHQHQTFDRIEKREPRSQSVT